MDTLAEIDAVILCGGLGTRLRRVIGEKQKVLAQVGDKAFLGILLNRLVCQGCRRFVLCAGYQAEAVRQFLQDFPSAVEVEVSVEEQPLGTGGALKRAASLVRSGDFFVLNGDSYCDVDLAGFLAFHRGKQAVASVALTRVEDQRDYGSIHLGEENRILAFAEKMTSGKTALINAGVYCFNKDIFTLMPAEARFSLEKDLFPALIEKRFYGFPVDGDFFDIGTPERLKEAAEFFKKKDGQ